MHAILVGVRTGGPRGIERLGGAGGWSWNPLGVQSVVLRARHMAMPVDVELDRSGPQPEGVGGGFSGTVGLRARVGGWQAM